jgi:hypothetical protein
VNMSKEGKLNSSSGGHSHDKWNMEGDKVKLHEAISSLRTLVSGETNALSSNNHVLFFLTNWSNIHILLLRFSETDAILFTKYH